MAPGVVLDTEIPKPGTFFKNYYVIAPLGEGGMSEVFLGYDLLHPGFVALKFLVGLFGKNRTAVGRLRREGEIYRKLDHPCIVGLVDQGDLRGGGAFLVQEFLRGDSVRERLEEGPLPIHEALILAEDAASGLHAAHRQGIIHRDVKPDNLMAGLDGRGTLFDFGIAYRQDDLVDTASGTLMGTMSYLDPAGIRGEPLDHRSDIFGLGAVLYEMLTGRIAVRIENYKQALRHRLSDIPLPSQLRPEVPGELDELICRMLGDERDLRMQDLLEFSITLGKLRVTARPEDQVLLFGDPSQQTLDHALKAFREENFEAAKGILAQLSATPEAERGEIQHLLAKIQLAQGHEDAAIRAFLTSLEQDPFQLQVVLDYAFFLLGRSRFEEAHAFLRELPSVIRGNFLVRCLIDTIQAIPEAPPEAWSKHQRQGGWRGFLGSLKSLWK